MNIEIKMECNVMAQRAASDTGIPHFVINGRNVVAMPDGARWAGEDKITHVAYPERWEYTPGRHAANN